MAVFSPLPAYAFGTAFFGLSLSALLAPRNEYRRFGLPLESPAAASGALGGDGDGGFASPLIYLKAIRELTYGAALVALQYQGHEAAVTTLVAVLSLAALGDGCVIWAHGREVRGKAFGHWVPGAGFLVWALWRWRRS